MISAQHLLHKNDTTSTSCFRFVQEVADESKLETATVTSLWFDWPTACDHIHTPAVIRHVHPAAVVHTAYRVLCIKCTSNICMLSAVCHFAHDQTTQQPHFQPGFLFCLLPRIQAYTNLKYKYYCHQYSHMHMYDMSAEGWSVCMIMIFVSERAYSSTRRN